MAIVWKDIQGSLQRGGGEIGWNEAAKQWTDSDEAAKRPQAAVALTIDWQ